MTTLTDNYRRLTILLKWIELMVAIVSIAVLQQYGNFPGLWIYRTAVIYAAICGYIIILPVILVGYNVGQEISKLLVMIWLFIASFLWLTAGGLIFERYFNPITTNNLIPGALIGSGILAFLNGCLFAVDIVFTYREE